MDEKVQNLILGDGQAEFSALKMLWQGDRVKSVLNGELIAPIQIELSLTMDCNIACVWCVDLPWRTEFHGKLDKDLLLTRLAEFYELGTRSIVIEGGGEPTTHPDFREIVLSAKKIGFALGLITNGVLMNRYADLVDNFEWVRVSLDAYDDESYVALKGKNFFGRVMKGLEDLVAAKKEKKANTVIGVGYLSSKLGIEYQYLDDLVATLKGYGTDYIQVRRITNPEQFDDDNGKDTGFVDLSFLKKYEDENYKVHIHQMAEFITGNAGVGCLAHQFVAVIGGSGEMFVCCRLRTQQNDFMGQLGDLRTQTAKEILFGEERKEWVEKLKNPAFTGQHCPECRHTKFNIILDQVAQSEKTKDFI